MTENCFVAHANRGDKVSGTFCRHRSHFISVAAPRSGKSRENSDAWNQQPLYWYLSTQNRTEDLTHRARAVRDLGAQVSGLILYVAEIRSTVCTCLKWHLALGGACLVEVGHHLVSPVRHHVSPGLPE